MSRFAPLVVERDGRFTGYMMAPSSYLANHGVAETDEDMGALLAGVCPPRAGRSRAAAGRRRPRGR
jgi:hypothetical protein